MQALATTTTPPSPLPPPLLLQFLCLHVSLGWAGRGMNILLSITAISAGVSDMQTNTTPVCSDGTSEVWLIARSPDQLIRAARLL